MSFVLENLDKVHKLLVLDDELLSVEKGKFVTNTNQAFEDVDGSSGSGNPEVDAVAGVLEGSRREKDLVEKFEVDVRTRVAKDPGFGCELDDVAEKGGGTCMLETSRIGTQDEGGFEGCVTSGVTEDALFHIKDEIQRERGVSSGVLIADSFGHKLEEVLEDSVRAGVLVGPCIQCEEVDGLERDVGPGVLEGSGVHVQRVFDGTGG